MPQLWKLLSGQLDEVEELVVHFTIAEQVRKTLTTSYSRPAIEERPLSLPADDGELVERLNTARFAKRPTVEDSEVLRDFGEWRNKIAHAELDGLARIEVLVGALRTYRKIETLHPGTSVQAMFDEVADHLAIEWGIKLTTELPDYWETRKLAEPAARRTDVLPLWVRALRASRRTRDTGDSTPKKLDFGGHINQDQRSGASRYEAERRGESDDD